MLGVVLHDRHMLQLAKTLVCLQILWMFVQCLGRFFQELPITIIELHTVIQVCYTILIYVLWWDKTVDVVSPSFSQSMTPLFRMLESPTISLPNQNISGPLASIQPSTASLSTASLDPIN